MEAEFTTQTRPMVVIMRTSDLVKVRQIGFGFKLIFTNDIYAYHLVPQTLIAGNTLFMHGLTQQIWSSEETARFPFLASFDLATEKLGGHLA